MCISWVFLYLVSTVDGKIKSRPWFMARIRHHGTGEVPGFSEMILTRSLDLPKSSRTPNPIRTKFGPNFHPGPKNNPVRNVLGSTTRQHQGHPRSSGEGSYVDFQTNLSPQKNVSAPTQASVPNQTRNASLIPKSRVPPR